MIRNKEHYIKVILPELAISGESTNVYESPKLKSISLHYGLKGVNFDPFIVAPTARLNEIISGSRCKRTVTEISEPSFDIRKGEITGITSRRCNGASVLEFVDSRT